MQQWTLIRLRKENNLLQKDLGKLLGITEESYGMKERGRSQFTMNEMFMLSRIFRLPIEQIFLSKDFGNTEVEEG